jgi:hypothetical protein
MSVDTQGYEMDSFQELEYTKTEFKEAMELKVQLTYAFGCTHIRPDCEKSKIFARIAGTTKGNRPTLTQSVVDDLKLLGYTITVTNNVTKL